MGAGVDGHDREREGRRAGANGADLRGAGDRRAVSSSWSRGRHEEAISGASRRSSWRARSGRASSRPRPHLARYVTRQHGTGDRRAAQLHLAAELARETQSWTDLARAAVNESGILVHRSTRRSGRARVAAAADAVQHGLERRATADAFLRLNATDCLLELARYDEAEAMLERIDRTRPAGIDELRRLESWAALQTARGDLEAAADSLAPRLRVAAASRVEEASSTRVREAELAVRREHGRLIGVVDDRPPRPFGDVARC